MTSPKKSPNKSVSISHPPSKRAFVWLLWFFAVGFYFYDVILQVFPSVMIEALMATFDIRARLIGEITGSYFYIYGFMQIPVGLLMDRMGAPKLLTIASFICGLGGVCFGLAPNAEVLVLARLLAALGSSFAFVGLVYISSHWFKKSLTPLLIGIGNSLGMIGGVFGEGPISIVENFFGWRLSVILLGTVGLLFSFFILFTVRNIPPSEKPRRETSSSIFEAFKEFKVVIASKQAWLNSVISLFMFATTTAFAALWGVFFLQHQHGMQRSVAGFANSMIYIGWVIGGPLIGQLSANLGFKRPFLMGGSLLAGLLMLLLILSEQLSELFIFFLLLLVGICSSAQLLTFGRAIDLFPKKATGSASAFTNFMVTMGGVIFQPLVGALITLAALPGTAKMAETYSKNTLSLAFICFPLSFFAAFCLTFFMKEKHPKHFKA